MAEEMNEDEQQVARIETEPAPEKIPMPTEEQPPQPVSPQSAVLPVKSSFKEKLKRFWHTKKGKATVIVLVIIILLAVLYIIPTTRYGILGTFIKKQATITVVDSTTMKAVTQADVTLGAYTAKTNNKGVAEFSALPVGQYTLKISKKYYKEDSTSYEMPVFGSPNVTPVHLVATGRQTVVSVVNKITSEPIPKATITLSDTSAITDDLGKATLVLPADKQSVKATVTGDGYNQADADIKVGGQTPDSVGLTPVGTLFYLSKQTGKINVMKSNLDGSNVQTVIEGTGNESDRETTLLSTRDWKYMALSAVRDPKQKAQLSLIDAATGKLSTIDQGDVSFQLVGWSNHRFIYTVYNNNKKLWENGVQSLKSFDAETGKTTLLDETTATGTNAYDLQRETVATPYIVEGKVVYAKSWNFGNDSIVASSSQKLSLMSVNPDGTQKQHIRDFAMRNTAYIDTQVYEPQSLYVKVTIDNTTPVFYEYEDGQLKGATVTDNAFVNTTYPTFLISPTGKKTLWTEDRDGKKTVFVGDANAKDPATLLAGSDFTAYGWYGDDYILLSKNDSELYIAPAKLNDGTLQPLKVTNYHKPAVRLYGYGTGYGGI